ncbi:hypothetical protein MKW98_002074 [Papaver atlanticum]|uniref:Uncharacterized protein n=1 Tax=Papaver atlanticum TaxID=357466 RepID=A0AAD4X2R1_9MAGN|nr:hypothetical protein MKW98_002074 [Papaver atlanticum]
MGSCIISLTATTPEGMGSVGVAQSLSFSLSDKLHIKLLEESPRHTVALHVQEYFYCHALQIKAKMLCSFSTMFDAALEDPHKAWIRDRLKEEKAEPEVLLSKSEDSIEHLDTNVKLMDENVQSDINKQKEEHLQHLEKFHHGQNEFQACNFDEMKEEFENLKLIISDAEASMSSLTKLAGSCNRTLGTVKRTTLKLGTVFFRLLHRSENDLSKRWSEETHYVNEHVLVRREKEKYEKATAECDRWLEKIKRSSGLLH